MRLGTSVPYLGVASGASSATPGPVSAGGATPILCISAGVVSRRKWLLEVETNRGTTNKRALFPVKPF